MKVNFNHEFVNAYGQKITIAGTKNVATLATCAFSSLMHPTQAAFDKMRGEEKRKRHDLAIRIKNFGNDVVLTAEDKGLIEEAIGDMYGMEIVGQTDALLHGKPLPDYAKPKEAETTAKAE